MIFPIPSKFHNFLKACLCTGNHFQLFCFFVSNTFYKKQLSSCLVSGALYVVARHWTTSEAARVKMRAMVRSVRHFRCALRLRTVSYSSNFAKREQSRNLNSGLAKKLQSNAEIHGLRNLNFMISRALSADAAKLANGGYFSFILLVSICLLTEEIIIEGLNIIPLTFGDFCVSYFQSQMWTGQDLLLNMNEELLLVSSLMVMPARYCDWISTLLTSINSLETNNVR